MEVVSVKNCLIHLLLGTVLICHSACCSDLRWKMAAARPKPYTEPVTREQYRIQPADDLEIKFFFNPELNERVTVYPDGTISLLLVGSIPAEGFTSNELKQKLTKLYSQKIRRPELAVLIRKFGSQRIYVGGEVNKPRSISLIGKMDILQAIFEAGGFKKSTACIDSVIVISRDHNNRPVGKVFNLLAFINGQPGGSNSFLQPYDIVVVPQNKIDRIDVFVDQYIRKVLPFSTGFAVQYNINGYGN